VQWRGCSRRRGSQVASEAPAQGFACADNLDEVLGPLMPLSDLIVPDLEHGTHKTQPSTRPSFCGSADSCRE
jgi:hypothetical protein